MGKLLLVLLLSGCMAQAQTFDPDLLEGADIVYRAPCSPYFCFVLSKDGTDYLVVLNPKTNQLLYVYKIVEKELELLWSSEMI